MADAAPRRPNPYVGPRSFQVGERIYGRDREANDLCGLLIAERIVLLHSPSGAGKTSLIHAALIPMLQEHEFTVLPVMRVSLEPTRELLEQYGAGASDRTPVPNRYVTSLLLTLEEPLPDNQQLPLDDLLRLSFDEYLNRRATAGELQEDDVLIFDQFEEILTINPTDQQSKAEFFAQVGAALRNRRRWAIFCVREDYIAGLTPYLRLIPTRLSTTYRLDFLSAAAAQVAIQQPARDVGIRVENTVATQLIDDLRRVQVQRPDGTVEEQLGPTVEPVHLQVVCFRLFDKLPADATEVRSQDLEAVGDVGQALAAYYAERVAAVETLTAVSERVIRQWFDRQLITPQGIRGQVLQGTAESQGLPNPVIWPLIDAYLVRAEKRRGATWFELAHDRLIEPVQSDNAAWFQQHLSPLQRQADLWASQSRPSGLLLRGELLAEAEHWAAGHADELTQSERDLLALSQEARARAARERRNYHLIRGLAVVATLLLLLAIYFIFEARTQAARAQAQEQLARRAERFSRARELAAAAASNLIRDPELSVQLGMVAVTTTRDIGEQVVPEAVSALQQAVVTSRVERTLLGNAGAVLSVAYSPDGKHFAAATDGLGITVWDVATGQHALSFGESSASILSIVYSPDGTQVATAHKDGMVRVWGAATGTELIAFKADAGVVNQVAFAPDGLTLATAGDDVAAKVWDARTGTMRRALEGHTGSVTSIAFDRSGTRLATGSDDKTARVWDAAAGEMLLTLSEHTDSVTSVAFSPVAAELATGSVDRKILIWSLAEEEVTQELIGHSGSVYDVAFDNLDGSLLVSAGADDTVKVWNSAIGQELLTLAGHKDRVNQAAFSPDRLHVATASDDKTARIWNLRFLHTEWSTFVAFSQDGNLIGTVGEERAHFWDVEAEREVALVDAPPDDSVFTTLTFSPDGKQIATGSVDGQIKVWDAASGKELHTLIGHDDSVSRLAFSSDSKLLASAGDDSKVRVWDATTGQLLHTFENFTNWVYGLAFNPDGRRLATGDQDGNIKVWDIRSGQELSMLQELGDYNPITSMAFNADGSRLAISKDGTGVTLVNFASGEVLPTLEQADLTGSNFVSFSPDGKLLASAGRDTTIKVWNVEARKLWLTLPHPIEVHSLAFSPDGASLATAGDDNVVRIFSLDLDALLKLAGQRITRELTPAECEDYKLMDRCAHSR